VGNRLSLLGALYPFAVARNGKSSKRDILTQKEIHMVRVAFFILLAATIGRAETAEEMLSSCKKLSEAKVSDGKVTAPPDFDSGQCFGSFRAIQFYSKFAGPDYQPVLHVCIPKDNTVTQLLAIFIDYVKRNPKTLSQDFFLAAHNSLVEAFPCSAQK
jgi:hypothetical protein